MKTVTAILITIFSISAMGGELSKSDMIELSQALMSENVATQTKDFRHISKVESIVVTPTMDGKQFVLSGPIGPGCGTADLVVDTKQTQTPWGVMLESKAKVVRKISNNSAYCDL